MTNDKGGDESDDGSKRGRGVLSSADRDYLRSDPDDYSRQARHARDQAIRERVENAVLDFTILFEHLEQDEREKIFDVRTTPVYDSSTDFEAGIRDALAFLIEGYHGHTLIDESLNDEIPQRMIEEAIGRIAWRHQHKLNGIQLEVDAEKIRWGRLLNRAEAGEELAADELAQLLLARGDDVDTAGVQEQIRNDLLDDDE